MAYAGDRLEVRAKLVFLGLLLLAMLAFLCAFPFLVFAKADAPLLISVIAAMCPLIGVYMVAAVYRYFTRRGPALVLDRAGLDHVWYGRVPWDQVVGIGLKTIAAGHGRPQAQLVLGVLEPGRYLRNRPAAMSWFTSASKLAAPYGELLVPVNVLHIAPERLREVALDLRGRVAPPLADGWFPGIDAQLFASQRESRALLQRLEELAGEAETRGADEAHEAETLLVAEAMAQESDAVLRGVQRMDRKRRRTQWLMWGFTGLALLLLVLRAMSIVTRH